MLKLDWSMRVNAHHQPDPLHHETARDRHGSGSILESHGGRLWATDNPSCGATFHVALPANVDTLQ
jgi:hypothetical protein